MDRVAFDFRERVGALWKCCDIGYHFEGCLNARVLDCDWTMKLKKERIDFVIGHDNGKWSYRFTNPDRTEGAKKSLSMEEMMKHRNLKHIRIEDMNVKKPASVSMHSMHALRSRADIERLMNFVIFLSNEPVLNLRILNVKDFDSPEGAILLNSLSTMLFSSICASYDYPVYNQIVENQFTRRKPTFLCIQTVTNGEFFIEHLGNGNIKKFSGPLNFPFPAEMMERLINRFLENSGNYEEYRIDAKFAESTKKMLERKLKEGRCVKVVHATKASTEYRFTVNNPELEKISCMRIEQLMDWRMHISMC